MVQGWLGATDEQIMFGWVWVALIRFPKGPFLVVLGFGWVGIRGKDVKWMEDRFEWKQWEMNVAGQVKGVVKGVFQMDQMVKVRLLRDRGQGIRLMRKMMLGDDGQEEDNDNTRRLTTKERERSKTTLDFARNHSERHHTKSTQIFFHPIELLLKRAITMLIQINTIFFC